MLGETYIYTVDTYTIYNAKLNKYNYHSGCAPYPLYLSTKWLIVTPSLIYSIGFVSSINYNTSLMWNFS